MKAFKSALKGYAVKLSQALKITDFDRLAEIACLLAGAWSEGRQVFIIGNGGSAATASHMANDLLKGCAVLGRPGFKVQALTDSSPVMTCLSNDFSFDDVFSIPLKTLANKGDILIAFSTSGNSKNVLKALACARELGVISVCFGGKDGGQMIHLGDLCLVAPSDSTEMIEDLHMFYVHDLSCALQARLKDMFGMEIIRRPRVLPRVALFDFDGTISLIREGWQDIMVPYFTDVLFATPGHESYEECARTVLRFVTDLTGKQTIFQCMRLDEEVVKRGGTHVAPIEYKNEYLRRLFERIKSRHVALRAGDDPEKYLVTGVRELLESLKAEGLMLYLASGTDEADVLDEARLLRIDQYFDGGVYGAKDDMTDCSKELVIKKIISENKLTGRDIVSFGDGYVEIELVKNIGGYSFGVASDEEKNCGVHLWKRERLLAAGADCIIPNFERPDRIIDLIKEAE